MGIAGSSDLKDKTFIMSSFRILSLICAVLVAISTPHSVNAFTTSFVGPSSPHAALTRKTCTNSGRRSSSMTMRVVDVSSEAAFDKTLKSAGSALVIVDYSTTWCGPCKVIAPKFEEMSDKYPDAVFLKVIGDSSNEASKLMKREGVRSVPSFHYFVDGEKVDVVNGANAEAIEAAIGKHMKFP